MKGGFVIRWLFLCLLLAPIAVTSSEPYTPWHEFTVSGHVQRGDGGPLRNYPVALFGKFEGETSWHWLGGCLPREAFDDEDKLTLTSTSGRFSLHVYGCYAPDTIAAAALLPDTMVVGTQVVTRRLASWPGSFPYEYEEDGFFCDDTVKGELEGTRYDYVDALTILIPTVSPTSPDDL